tara:strand:+ start:52 stop:582 length:531 start_codon:yes stop_codon:yes gene_type:complete
MANNVTDLYEIISNMRHVWTTNRCGVATDSSPDPMFHFGYPQDVDEIHNKDLPLMIVNPPTSSSVVDEYEKNRVNNLTLFKLQIYNYTPSRYNITDDEIKAEYWDRLETCFYEFINALLDRLGSKVVLGSGTVQISRRTQSSNDQMLQIEVTFNLNYFRYCLNLVQDGPPPSGGGD